VVVRVGDVDVRAVVHHPTTRGRELGRTPA
jgi:hypothetical protein